MKVKRSTVAKSFSYLRLYCKHVSTKKADHIMEVPGTRVFCEKLKNFTSKMSNSFSKNNLLFQ